MKSIGTIIPSRESLRAADLHSRKIDAARREVGNALPGCVAKWVNGEMRYYRTATIFAVIGRDMSARWFEIRADGEYSINGSR